MSAKPQTGYDKVFDNVLRLRIMSVLMVNPSCDFTSFKELLQVTDGNLASHLRHLENTDYIQVAKSFAGRKPLTTYSATETGKKAFRSHLEFLEHLITASKTS
jgi:DNA-binding MarR family transcriptional regulator